MGENPSFASPIIQRRIFLNIKNRNRDKEIKYYQKLIGNSQRKQ